MCVLLFWMNRLKHRKKATSVRISCWCGNFAVNPEKCANSKSLLFKLVLKFLRLGLRKAVGNWDEISSRPWCPRHILPKTDIEETVTEWSVTDLGDVSAIAIRRDQVVNELQFTAFPAFGFAGRHHRLAGRTSSLAFECF